MSIKHLSEDELDRALVGEDLADEVVEHLASCLVCRRRRDAFLAAAGGAQIADPDEVTRARVRERALSAWSGEPARGHWKRWLAAAAAVVLLALLPILRRELAPRPRVNADAVLVEVDAVLAQDPLAAVAPEDVVEAVAPVPDLDEEEGSWS